MKLYINGEFHCMDDARSVHTALLEDCGKIIELGATEDLVKLHPEAELCDLGGKVVIPGIIDTHTHLFAAAYSEMSSEIPIFKSVRLLLEDLKTRVKSARPGEWIVYRNTYPMCLEELRYPTFAELSDAAPENPVSVDGFYSAQVNAAALKLLDMSALPDGGEAVLDADGNPTGIITCSHEYLSKFYGDGSGDPDAALEKLMKNYNSCGMTGTVVGMCTPDDIRRMRRFFDAGRQNLRTRYTLPAVENVIEEGLSIDTGDRDMARVTHAKNFLDGGFLSGTAYMEYPYKNLRECFSLPETEKFSNGLINFDVAALAKSIRLARKHGLQYGAHAVGSGASKRLIAAYGEVNAETPINGERHALIHADFFDGDMASECNEMGIMLLFQPGWHYLAAPYVERILDERDVARFMKYTTMHTCILNAAGSDHMVKHSPDESVLPYNPFLGMYNIVTCRAVDGKEHWRESCLGREHALIAYTRDAAKATFDETITGTLEKGKYADFAVLDKNYFTCPEEEIPGIRSVLTVVGGREVYKAAR